MESTGNLKVNAELEYKILPQYTKLTPTATRYCRSTRDYIPTNTADRQAREAFIKAKYDDKLFAGHKT